MNGFFVRLKPFRVFSLPLFFLALVFLDYATRFVYGFAGPTRLLALWPMLFTGGWALLLTALTALLPRLGRRIAMGALGLFYSFLALLNGVMFNIFGHFFSFADMNFAGDGAKFFSWTYLRLPKKFWFFLGVFLLMTALAILLAGEPGGRWKSWKVRVGALALAGLSLAPLAWASHSLTPKEDAM